MDTGQIIKAVLHARGPTILVGGIVLLVLSATNEVSSLGLSFDLPGRRILLGASFTLGILGTIFILRDRPWRTENGHRSDCPVRSRGKLPKMDQWDVAQQAQDILMIGQNLNLVLRQNSFFVKKLQENTKIRLVIINPKDETTKEVLLRGVVSPQHTKNDFDSSLGTIRELREALPDGKKSLVELRTIDYVPTLCFQLLDSDKCHGTILVELTPNRIDAQNRPHFLLHRDKKAHSYWYQRFLENCNKMYENAKTWEWEA